MKKITFNAPLNHKAHNYKPMQIEVEKVITLYGREWNFAATGVPLLVQQCGIKRKAPQKNPQCLMLLYILCPYFSKRYKIWRHIFFGVCDICVDIITV